MLRRRRGRHFHGAPVARGPPRLSKGRARMDLACTNRCQSEGGVIMQTHAQQMKSASALACHATRGATPTHALGPCARGSEQSWSEQLGTSANRLMREVLRGLDGGRTRDRTLDL